MSGRIQRVKHVSHALRRGWVLVTGAAVAAPLMLVAPMLPAAEAATAVSSPIEYSDPSAAIALTPIGTHQTGVFDKAAAEIVAAYKNYMFVVSANAGKLQVLDYSDPTNPTKITEIAVTGIPNSVAVRSDGLGAIAVEAPVKTDRGSVVFFDANFAFTATNGQGAILGTLDAGAQPDMVGMSPDGAYAVLANEGEPNIDYTVDPEGSVTVVALPTLGTVLMPAAAQQANFHEFEAGGTKTLPAGVRIFAGLPNPLNKVSENLEPEYVTIQGTTAFVSLQENNAIAEVDLTTATVTAIRDLGLKDHGVAGNGMDPSDKDSKIDIRLLPGVKGIYMPDSLASYQSGGQTYIVSANEGDSREWGSFVDAARVSTLGTAPKLPICADSPLAGMTAAANLGRLNVSTVEGLNAAGTCYEELHSMGGRSFSIWNADGTQVFDSGDAFERITSLANPAFFNSNHTANDLEGRSDDKGPEPEALTLGTVGGRTYAFIGFERVGGIAVYDITTPASATFVTYVNNRDFSKATTTAAAGDLGPEGMTFVPASQSPNGEPLLLVANEVSGSTTVYDIADLTQPLEIDVVTANDFHGRLEANLASSEAGAAGLAGAVASYPEGRTIFASAGDNIGASTFTSFVAQDTPTIDALRTAGLTVSAVGNHEFDRGLNDLTSRVLPGYGGTQFGLGANVYLKGTQTPALQEYALVKRKDKTIAFIGTVSPQTASMVDPAGISTIDFGDQLAAANRVATSLAQRSDIDAIVLLAHDGFESTDCNALISSSSSFATMVRDASADIDAIVSAHTHQKYNCQVPITGAAGVTRPVIQAHQYGTTLGELTFSFASGTGALTGVTSALVPLVASGAQKFTPNAAVAKIVSDAVATATVQGAAPAGAISADILRGKTGTGTEDRGIESSLGNLIADAYLWATKTATFSGSAGDLAVMNPGGLRADLRYGTNGNLTLKDVANVQPFANTIVTVEVTGAQLKQILEEQWQPAGASRPKLHLGLSKNFSYTYDPNLAKGSHIVDMSLNGTKIDVSNTTKKYRVVTNSFLGGGGDNFTTFKQGTNLVDTGLIDLNTTVEYFKAKTPIAPPAIGRAAIVDPAKIATPPTGSDADRAAVDLGAAGLSVEPGANFDVTLTSLTANARLKEVWVHSDPFQVQTPGAADSSGVLNFNVSLPQTMPAGVHHLVITYPDGSVSSTEFVVFDSSSVAGVTGGVAGVVSAVAGLTGLSETGASASLWTTVLLALALILGGLVVVLRNRNARTED